MFIPNMPTRNILDDNNEVIGTLTLGNYVTEEQWVAMLEAYKKFLMSTNIQTEEV